jgi:hypothetical protein
MHATNNAMNTKIVLAMRRREDVGDVAMAPNLREAL